MPVPPSPTPPSTPRPPADPAPWLARTEELVDAYRLQLPGTATSAELGLGYIWIAADHIFECQGGCADFALLDVMKLMEDCHWLLAGKKVPFVGALASFYAYLGAARVIDPARAERIRAELLGLLDHS
ncbi:MAG TPA: hypothetical protein VJV78_05960 [Polyangiales bacterium]|nr:hypothetical protein [Polyangiales bacterium]